jgi:N-dimethylarginine dimethylaminohydrolase
MVPKTYKKTHEVLTQWGALFSKLMQMGRVELVDPEPGMPDLTFTANAAVVLDGKAFMARFKHAERQQEEQAFLDKFTLLQSRGILSDIKVGPADIAFEGAGDCVYDRAHGMFWLGWGQRTDPKIASHLQDYFGLPVQPLRLMDPRFYHLDTCFRPLPSGHILYYPAAFSGAGRDDIQVIASCDSLIPLSEQDACQFCANAVVVGTEIIMSDCSTELEKQLNEIGYTVCRIPLTQFHKSGGSAFCLTLQLDNKSP